MSEATQERSLVLKAAAGVLPMSLLMHAKDALQLDGLHLVLIELLFLLMARLFLFSSPKKQITEVPVPASTAADPQPASPAEPPSHSKGDETSTKEVKAEPVVKRIESKLYPQLMIDRLLWHFVSFVDPSLAPLLPPHAVDASVSVCPLSTWTTTFTQDALIVKQHPERHGLYASTDHFPDVDLRAIYEMMVNLEVRKSWDSLTERTEPLEQLPYHRGSADYLALRSLFPIKAKDLVLLSTYASLPPTSDGRRRIIAAAKSVKHPEKPPGTPGYSRMDIDISGFLLEDHHERGTLFTQISDLSSLGAWVPTKIINFITTNALPRGMRKVARAAATTPWPAHRQVLKDEAEWLPPPLNLDIGEQSTAPIQASESLMPSKSEAQAEASSSPPLPSDARALSAQVALLNQRLAALEGSGDEPEDREVSSSSSGWWGWPFNLLWSSSADPPASSSDGKGDLKVRRRSKQGRNSRGSMDTIFLRQVTASVGGIASVAALIAWYWTRRRR